MLWNAMNTPSNVSLDPEIQLNKDIVDEAAHKSFRQACIVYAVA
jgi:hypothetical protein